MAGFTRGLRGDSVDRGFENEDYQEKHLGTTHASVALHVLSVLLHPHLEVPSITALEAIRLRRTGCENRSIVASAIGTLQLAGFEWTASW